jgi:hypothetical protein
MATRGNPTPYHWLDILMMTMMFSCPGRVCSRDKHFVAPKLDDLAALRVRRGADCARRDRFSGEGDRQFGRLHRDQRHVCLHKATRGRIQIAGLLPDGLTASIEYVMGAMQS